MSRAPVLLASLALTLACDSGTSVSTSADGAAPERQGAGADAQGEISDQCDAAKVLALSQTLGSTAAREQPDVVGKHLPDACTLPEALTLLLAATAQVDESSTATLLGAKPDTYRKALLTICPAAGAVTEQVAQANPKDRQGLLFDACKFARFGLVDREQYQRHEAEAALALYAQQWLLDQGLTTAQAEPISRALLLRTMHRWAKPGQELPVVSQALGPVPDGAVVYATTKGVFFNEKMVVALDDQLPPDPAATQSHLIGPLFDELAEEAEKSQHVAAASDPARPWDPHLVIIADARLPYSSIVDILFTAGRAKYSKYSIVAEVGPLQYGAVPVEPPKFSRVATDVPELGVEITKDGYTIVVSNEADPPDDSETINGTGETKWDLVALAARATKHHTDNDGATRAYIAPDDTLSWGLVVQTMAAVRGSGCDTDPKKCILPDLVIGASGPTGIPRLARNFDPDMMARHSGLLGMMASDAGHFVVSPYGAAFGVGDDDEDVWGGLTGTEIGEAYGVGGLGLVGTGRGTGEGAIGLGNVGLIGKSSSPGSGAGFGGRGKRAPTVRAAKANVKGDLDKDVISRIVKAHINEIRYCYNQALAEDPKLSGSVNVQFTIGPTGKVPVAVVSETTLKDKDASNCMAKAVKRWSFPRPGDGSNVLVTQPFKLDPG